MGLQRLMLVAPQRFPDPEATARASGASDLLDAATVCSSLDEALQGTVFAIALSARARDLGPEPAQARQAALDLLARAETGEVALVFGNETSGLSNAELQRCHAAVTIPANLDYSSLNLGAAVQILAYELRMAAFDAAPPRPQLATPSLSDPATHEEIEGFYGHLERLMIRTGFHDPARPKRLLPKLRRLFGRAQLEKDEVNILRGIVAAAEMAAEGRTPGQAGGTRGAADKSNN
ncbi:MAG: hypothetical protein RIR00_1527 [Pseudomonadota bacterium]